MSGGGTVVEEDHLGEREEGHGLGDGRLADHDIRDGQERLQYMGVVTQGLGSFPAASSITTSPDEHRTYNNRGLATASRSYEIFFRFSLTRVLRL